jgi:hypothetical protein
MNWVAISQKTVFFIITAVKTSNLINLMKVGRRYVTIKELG